MIFCRLGLHSYRQWLPSRILALKADGWLVVWSMRCRRCQYSSIRLVKRETHG